MPESAAKTTPCRRAGAVVIGRNEGERLKVCLRSTVGACERTVYVDSGSTDGSVEAARALGAEVVNLDMAIPFSAARARNAGARRLLELDASIEAIQFIDGDCEMHRDWFGVAIAALDADPSIGMICGRLRERNVRASVYNRLCDVEWNRAPGRVQACGGLVMVRREVLERTGGYDERLVAGEDPELCIRAGAAGWGVLRLASDMAVHDAGMTRFGQWWKRMRRGGWGFAASAALHGSLTGGYKVGAVVSALVWGLAMPSLMLAMLVASAWWPWALWAMVLVVALYARLLVKTFRWTRKAGVAKGDAAIYAVFCTLAKTAEGLGVLQYAMQRLRGRQGRLIEYK